MKNSIHTSILLFLFSVYPSFAQYPYPFQDPGMPIEDRIDNLLSLMTIDEKVSCLGTDPCVPRLGV